MTSKHMHSAINSPDGGETCGICGENFRSGVHLRVGEPFPTARTCSDERPCIPCYSGQGACIGPAPKAADRA